MGAFSTTMLKKYTKQKQKQKKKKPTKKQFECYWVLTYDKDHLLMVRAKQIFFPKWSVTP